MNYRLLLLCLSFCCLATSVSAQKPAETREEYEAAYKRRIRMETLNQVYIPKDLADAFNELNKKIDADSEQRFLSLPDSVAADKLFFSLGRWIQVNWGFYGGSRFSHYLKGIGLSHPEDMARFVIITYHRNLSRVPLDVKPLVEGLVQTRQAAVLERRKAGEVLDEQVRQRPRN